jgi:hypothetical protein
MGADWVDPAVALRVTGYWGMAFLMAVWTVAAVWWWKQNRFGWWQRLGWRGCVWVLVAWLFLVTREPSEFKVVMDEPMLMSASMGMHMDRSPAVPRTVYELAGQREAQEGPLDKRPLLFPFLLSLLHDVFGCRVENVFLLNKALMLVLVLLAWLAGRRLDPACGGPLFLFWLCGWPLIAQNACGGGFEIFNLALVLLTFLAATRYLEARCAVNEVFLLVTCLLLANTRYEAVFYLLVFSTVWLGGAILDRSWSVSWVTVFSPLLLLPCFWQRVMVATSERWSMELADRAASRALSWGYVSGNVAHAWRFLAMPDPLLAGSPLFGALGSLALLGLAFVLIQFRKHAGLVHTASLVSASLVVVVALFGFGILMAYFWGELDDPVASRLALPLIGAMGLALCAVRPCLLPSPSARKVLLGIMMLWIVGYAMPVANEHRYTQNAIHARIFEWSRDVIARTGTKHPLVIGLHARIWTAYQEAALTPNMAWASMPQIACQRQIGTFDEVFVVQSLQVDPTTGARALLPGNRLPDGMVLEPIAESSFFPFNRTRISRVKSIDLDRISAEQSPAKEPAVVFRAVGAN